MDFTHTRQGGDDLQIVEHLLAGGEIVAAQLPTASNWSPERKLAATVLADALAEVRDHSGIAQHRRQVADALRWIYSNNRTWPYSFLRLCDEFGLTAGWVRQVVRRWERAASPKRPTTPRYRHAA
jgi:hypothetical protein